MFYGVVSADAPADLEAALRAAVDEAQAAGLEVEVQPLPTAREPAVLVLGVRTFTRGTLTRPR